MHSETHSDNRSSPKNKRFVGYWKFSWRQYAISSRVNAILCTEVEVTGKINENSRPYTLKYFILYARKNYLFEKLLSTYSADSVVTRVWVWRPGNRFSIFSSHRRFHFAACTAAGAQTDSYPIHRTVNWPLSETVRSEYSKAKVKQSLYRRLRLPGFETIGTWRW